MQAHTVDANKLNLTLCAIALHVYVCDEAESE